MINVERDGLDVCPPSLAVREAADERTLLLRSAADHLLELWASPGDDSGFDDGTGAIDIQVCAT